MTLPAFQAAGTGSETAPAWPTHVAGHFGILFVENPDSTIATPSGWTLLYQVISGAAIRLSMFWKFATSDAETAPTVTPTPGGNHQWSTIITYTGVNTSNPIHSLSVCETGSSTFNNASGLTTHLDDCLIVIAYAWLADNAGPLASTEVNADLASLAERYDAGTLTGNGGGLAVFDGTLATAGIIRATEIRLASASVCATATIALQAATETLGNKTRIINTGM